MVRIVDLAGRFRGSRTFVEEAEKAFLEFYAKVGQYLIPSIPRPPKVKETKLDTASDDQTTREDIRVQDLTVLSVEAEEPSVSEEPNNSD